MTSLYSINDFFKTVRGLGFNSFKVQKAKKEDINHNQVKIMKSIGIDLYKENIYKIIIDNRINVFVTVKNGLVESPVKGFYQSAYFHEAQYADDILWKLRQNKVIPSNYKISKVSQFDGGTGEYYRWGQELKNFTAGEVNILKLLSCREEDKNPKTLEEIYSLFPKGYKLETHYGYIFKDVGLKDDSKVNGLEYPELKTLKSLKS